VQNKISVPKDYARPSQDNVVQLFWNAATLVMVIIMKNPILHVYILIVLKKLRLQLLVKIQILTVQFAMYRVSERKQLYN